MRNALLAWLALVMICTQAVAQTKLDSNRKSLAFFKPYIGTWTKHGVLKQDNFFAQKGAEGTSSITWRWVYGRNAIEWEWVFDYDGKKSGTRGLLSWDASEKCLVGAGVAPIGGMIQVRSKSLDPLTLFVYGKMPDGKPASQIETFTLTGDNTMTIQATERKGMPVTEDGPKEEFTRVEQALSPNYEHLKSLEWLIGEWVGEVEAIEDIPGVIKKGDPLKMTFKITWGPNKSLIRTHANVMVNDAIVSRELRLLGWDPNEKRIVDVGFNTAGGHINIFADVVDEHTVKARVRDIKPDGTVHESVVTAQCVNDDTLNYVVHEITVDGEKQTSPPPTTAKRIK